MTRWLNRSTRYGAGLRRSAIVGTVLLGFVLPASVQQAAAQAPKPCTFPFGWWENPGLPPLHGGPNQAPKNNCEFQLWSWSTFVHFMQTDKASGQPMFLLLPTYDDLHPDAARLTAAQAKALIHPRELVLRPRDNQPQTLGSFQQAGPKGVLVDQHGRAVYYVTHMDPTYFNFTQQYFGPNNYKKASPTLNYPIGAAVLKSSWRIVQPGEDTSNVYTTTATIPLLESDGKGKLKLSGKMQSGVNVALVGVHVVGVVQDHPEFLWATFEHNGNAPFLPPNMDPHSHDPVSQQSFTFYKAGTPANESNFLPKTMNIDVNTQEIMPITNVVQEFEFGGAPIGGILPIQQVNVNFPAKLKEQNKSLIDPVFANYRLNGTVWLLPNSLKPGDGDMDQEAIGAIDLNNATMETFVQGEGTNCFSCHRTTGGSTYPGKNINTSHIITSKLNSNPAVQRERGIENPLPALPTPLGH